MEDVWKGLTSPSSATALVGASVILRTKLERSEWVWETVFALVVKLAKPEFDVAPGELSVDVRKMLLADL